MEISQIAIISDKIMLDIINPLKSQKDWKLFDFLNTTSILYDWDFENL